MEETSSSSSTSTDGKSTDFKVSKKKKKPWKRQEPLLAGTTLRCSKCEYKTILPQLMRWHKKRHGRKSGHKCPLCSYCLKHKLDIYIHVRNHHSGSERDQILSERKGTDQVGSDPVADSEEEKDENDSEEWIYDANGNRKKVTHCGDCAYKSATRKYVENHVKRMHPNSTTALPTRPPAKCPEKMLLKQCPDCDYSTMSKKEMERHQIHHRTKFANHCTFCSFSADGWHAVSRHAKYYHSNTSPAVASSHHQRDTDNSSGKEKEEWHYCPGGKRIRYQFCCDCDYKSIRRDHLESHVKTLHPLSKTALPPPFRQRNHHCTLCQYKTHSKQSFREHQRHHRKRYGHRCHLCSYSAKSSDIIDWHFKNHHPSKKETADPKTTSKATFKCSQCNYSAINLTNLRLHEKGHSRNEKFKCSRCNFSSEYEYVIIRHLERHHHRKEKDAKRKSKAKVEKTNSDGKKVARDLASQKELLKCSNCLFKTNHRGRLACHEEAHKRSCNHNCTRCSFSSNYKGIVEAHMKRDHLKTKSVPNSTPLAPEEESGGSDIGREEMEVETKISDERTELKCLLCGFSSFLSEHMKLHEYGHERSGEFKCSLCSFSSYFQATIDNHLQDCHTLKERINAKATTRTSSRESQVTLDRFFGRATASSIKVDEIGEQKAPQCNVQLLRLNKEQEAKLLDLQTRIQVMQTKMITAQKELEEASSKKRDVWDKMKEIEVKKLKIENDLRAQQREALELNLMSLDDEAGHNDVVLAEYSAMCIEDDMKMFEEELRRLREQDAVLIEDVEVAEGSFIGANQVLLALMSDLDSLVRG